MKTTLCALLLVVAAPTAAAPDDWSFSGDIRAGLLGSETRARSGAVSDSTNWRARLRGGVTIPVRDAWTFNGRLAGLLDSEQTGESFELDWAAPSPSGLGTGQATIDTAHLAYAPAGSPWKVRVGRFQSVFELDGVAKKSLDRLDSPSFDVTWTDGVWVERRFEAVTAHAIIQHNDDDGPTNTLRSPLAFDRGGSRAGLFLGVAANQPLGPLVQRIVAVTWLPGALRPLGPAIPMDDDYLAVTAKTAAAWPIGDAGMRFLAALEVGYAPNTPTRFVMGSGTTGDADGLAWQASANLYDFVPSHSFGVVYGRVDDGWLISPDFRPNESAVEARWLWKVDASWAVDARVRRRIEMDLPLATPARRTEDFYVRATWRF